MASKAFFRRVKAKEKPGFPRYKGFGRYDSFTFPQGGYSLIDDLLTLSKIGKIKAIVHRPVDGKIKSCTIRRINNKWYACFSCEVETKPLDAVDKAVGIDVGIENFATLSNNSTIANPKFFKQESKSLAKAQRKLSKLAKGTKERLKAKQVVVKIHERISNKRNNFAHQESRRIVNSFDTICIEDLSINKMLSNGHRCLNRNIADVAWNTFAQYLAYKAEYAGRRLVKINPAYTSQTCSKCGHRHKMELSTRVFLCPCCGFSSHRDINASFNILSLGLQALGIPSLEAPQFIAGE